MNSEYPADSERNIERRLAAALSELHLWQERYRTVGGSIPYGMWVCDPQGHVKYCSKAMLDLLGMTMEQYAGTLWYATLHPDEALETERAWNECVRTGRDWVRLHRFKGKDGRFYPALARGRALRNSDGSIREGVGVNFDVSELIDMYEDLVKRGWTTRV